MAKRSYLRDGRAPVPASSRVSDQMSRIRAKDTGPERNLRNALAKAGVTGYRLNYAKAQGKPDVAFVGRKVAVFIHGCFWHCCPHCRPPRPRTHRDFWEGKLERNVQRDKRTVRLLRKAGWRVVTIWACRFRKFPESQVRRVERMIAAAGEGPVVRGSRQRPTASAIVPGGTAC